MVAGALMWVNKRPVRISGFLQVDPHAWVDVLTLVGDHPEFGEVINEPYSVTVTRVEGSKW
jgi:hypothetical protein